MDYSDDESANVQEFMEELRQLMDNDNDELDEEGSDLDSAKLMKKGARKIVHNSGHYAFTYQNIVDTLPAGYFQPGETRDGIFILSDLKKTKLNSRPVRIQDLVLTNMQSKSAKQSEANQQEYFPMENYSVKMKQIKQNIEVFIRKRSFYKQRHLD